MFGEKSDLVLTAPHKVCHLPPMYFVQEDRNKNWITWLNKVFDLSEYEVSDTTVCLVPEYNGFKSME